MAPGVEDSVVIFRFYRVELDRLRKLFLCSRVLLKPGHFRSLVFRQIALRIDRRLPSLRRRQRQLDLRVAKDEVRCGEFF
jgi:hypothetical protein